jgi:acid stress chaperone HdeB
MTREILRYAAVAAAFLIAGACAPAGAQTIIEMSVLKCKDYMESPNDRQQLIAAWMNGYFNAARNMPMVDYGRFATNKKRVEKFCRTHKNDNLMNVIKKVAF